MSRCPNGCGREFDRIPAMANHLKACAGPEHRRCSRCEEVKPNAAFTTQGARIHSFCRPCRNAADLISHRKRRMKLCEGKGHKGGPTSRKACVQCHETKANTAFQMGHDVCMKCERASEPKCSRCRVRRPERGHALCSRCRKENNGPPGVIRALSGRDLASERMSLEQHMASIHASEADWSVVRKAYARFGRKGPTADEVLEAYVGGYDTPHTRARYGQLVHATCLLASELAGNQKNRERAA